MRGDRQVVLVGAGHAHLHVAQHAEVLARAGARIVLVDPGVFWYSGLATGMLGGMYDAAADQIDAQRLIEAHGGQFVRDRVIGLDRSARRAELASGGALDYDVVSFNVGSEVDSELLADPLAHAWTVKPISNLWELRGHLEARFARGDPTRVVIIGGGATGCEIAANLDSLARRHAARLRVTLLTAGPRLLARHSAWASRCLTATLRQRGVEIVGHCRVQDVQRGVAFAANGERFEWDVLVVAAGLRAPRWLGGLGVAMDAADGMRVRATLQSTDDPCVFGAGDCVSFSPRPLPKLGVFGVRQAPVLLHNLGAFLRGERLRRYHPQRLFLAILNLGCGEALALWGPLHWQGAASLRLKDWLDRRFLDRYRLPLDERRGGRVG